MAGKNTVQKITAAAMLAALTCVFTMIVKIPTPLNGYVNMGDAIVVLAGWSLSPAYAFLTAGIGSALADLLSGYTAYAVPTFLIKGAMALIALFGVRLFGKKKGGIPAKIVRASLAEIFMVLGYFVFEGVLYGFAPSLVNIPANAIQGVVGLVLGCVLVRIFEKNKITLR